MNGEISFAGRVEHLQRMVAGAGLGGWLVADFRWNNPMFARLLDLHSGILTRRAVLWLPAQGEPRVLVSRVDGHAVAGLSCPVSLYRGYEDMVTLLRDLLPRDGSVAMEYVEGGTLPALSRVDAGFVELIRSFGVTVLSSGSLVAAMDVWDERQQSLHRQAAAGVDGARALALQRCSELLHRAERVTEGMLIALMQEYFGASGLVTHDGPDVGFGPNAADPHYSLDGREGAEIGANGVLLLDVWAKVADVPGAPYADTTWMAFTGSDLPGDVATAFASVRDAREAAMAAIDTSMREGRPIAGRLADQAANSTIARAGLADALVHRTGHSLGIDHVHGMGTNLDDVEFPDDRPLVVNSGFTVEPGVYFPGRFGIRSEVSAILAPMGVEVTTERQDDITLLT